MARTIEVQVAICLNGQKTKQPIQAYPAGSHFAVHRPCGLGAILFENTWVLTHIPTGHSVGSFRTRKAAIACAEKLEPMCNWAKVTSKGPPRPISVALRKMLLVAQGYGGYAD